MQQEIQSASCKAFFAHWQIICQGHRPPHSHSFLDHAPADLIPFAFILDLVPEGLQVRFMGTGLVQRWRHDLTGRSFGDDLDAEQREKMRLNMVRVIETPCGMVQIGRIESSTGRDLSFEAVALPLSVDPGRAPRVTIFSQILGSLVREEHSTHFRHSGDKAWLDLGWGAPADAPPA